MARLPLTKTIEEICALPQGQLEADFVTVQTARLAAESERVRLADDLRDASSRAARLLQQEQLLSLVLRMRSDAAIGVPGVSEVLRANAAAAPLARERNVSANVLSIVRQAEGIAVTPSYVLDRLSELGVEKDGKVIRTALRRWVERGMLEKDGPGYRAVDRSGHA